MSKDGFEFGESLAKVLVDRVGYDKALPILLDLLFELKPIQFTKWISTKFCLNCPEKINETTFREGVYRALRDYQDGKLDEGSTSAGQLDIPLLNVFDRIVPLIHKKENP